MTIHEIIETVKRVNPSVYEDSLLVDWLSRIEWKIKREIVDKHEGAEAVEFSGYDAKTDTEKNPIAPPPYDDLYVHYICAQICFFNGEYSRYQAYMSMHNSVYTSFAAWYNEEHKPKKVIFKFFGR